jgi:hypothetical protein
MSLITTPDITVTPMDFKFVGNIVENIQTKYNDKWFLENFTQFKTGNILKIDLGRIVKAMSMPDNDADLMPSLSMSSDYLITQIQYIKAALYTELPKTLNIINWKLTNIQFMLYDPDFVRYNKYTNTQIKGASTCQILAHIEQIEGKTPFCKNPNSPKEFITNVNKDIVNSKKNDEKECMKCHKKFTPVQSHYQNCIDCNKSMINTAKKCKTCPTIFKPEQPYYVNCPTCFDKTKTSGGKPVSDTKKCSDCSATFKPIKSHYHQCMTCFGKK